MKHFLSLCGVLALVLAATGCVKLKQAWTINPDGSGKMTMSIGYSEEKLNEASEDPFANLDDPYALVNLQDQGWVAYTKPEIVVRDGYKYATFTGYFEDINQVTFSGDGGNGNMEATQYRLADGTFTVSNGMLSQVIQSVANDPSMQDPQGHAFMRPMLEGMTMTETYRVPGDITDSEGYAVDDQAATSTLTVDDILSTTPPTIDGLEDGELTITFAPAAWTNQAAWTAELEQAKAQWAAIKEQAAVGASGN